METAAVNSRVQMEIGENIELREIYYKSRILLPNDLGTLQSYTYRIGDWLTLAEFWGCPDVPITEPYPFRITLYVIKGISDSTKLVFGLRADRIDRSPAIADPSNWQMLWEQAGDSFVLPIGEWFDLEVYYKEGNADTGRFWLAAKTATGAKQVIFDIHNFTRHPADPSPKGLRWFNPIKLYASKNIIDRVNGSGGELSVYFDDFDLWKNKQP